MQLVNPTGALLCDLLCPHTTRAALGESIPSSQRHGSAPLPDFAGHPARLLDLAHVHGAGELEAACHWALANNTTNLASVVSILETKVYLTGDQPRPPVSPIHDNLRHHDEFTNTEREA